MIISALEALSLSSSTHVPICFIRSRSPSHGILATLRGRIHDAIERFEKNLLELLLEVKVWMINWSNWRVDQRGFIHPDWSLANFALRIFLLVPTYKWYDIAHWAAIVQLPKLEAAACMMPRQRNVHARHLWFPLIIGSLATISLWNVCPYTSPKRAVSSLFHINGR